MATSNKIPLTLSLIKEHLSYDPETGHLRWRVKSCRRNAGDIAGSPRGNGYTQVGLLGHVYHAHRLAWAITNGTWPIGHGIDHVNGVRDDNRLCNLRAADQSENLRNRGPTKRSSTGVKGVFRHPHGGYMAQICHRYKTIYLGYFKTIDDARAAYAAASVKYQGEYGR